MTASTASRGRPAPKPSGDAAALRKRGDQLREQFPDLSDAQLRHLLQREGFPISGISSWLKGEDEPPKPAAGPAPASGKPPAPRSPSRGSGGLWEGPGTGAGVLLALICYPAALAYLKGGNAGLRQWFRAKFLNQTSSDPGITTEAWVLPGTSSGGGTSTVASVTGRRTPATSGGSGAGAEAVAFARAQVGLPYEWGGDGPAAGDKGWDCSGLTHAAWAAAGVKIPRTTAFQILLPAVSRKSMQPGDLVFPEPTHVQLYAGGGQIIEAPHTGLNVRVMPLGRVMAVRRPRAKRAKGLVTT